MTDDLIEVGVLGLLPINGCPGEGIAVFLGNDEKAFSIHVDAGVGSNIALILQGSRRERPTTHDLINLIFSAFVITVGRVVINDFNHDTYFARLTLKMSNEVQTRITEIDARPSDCLAIALAAGKPVYVARKVWDAVTDVSDTLDAMKKKIEQGDFEGLFGDAGAEDDDEDEDLPDTND